MAGSAAPPLTLADPDSGPDPGPGPGPGPALALASWPLARNTMYNVQQQTADQTTYTCTSCRAGLCFFPPPFCSPVPPFPPLSLPSAPRSQSCCHSTFHPRHLALGGPCHARPVWPTCTVCPVIRDSIKTSSLISQTPLNSLGPNPTPPPLCPLDPLAYTTFPALCLVQILLLVRSVSHPTLHLDCSAGRPR